MNVAEIRKKLDTLEGAEYTAAAALLVTLNISVEKKKKPQPKARGKFTGKLQPYYQRIKMKCLTCGKHSFRYYYFAVEKVEAQYLLKSHKISRVQYGRLSDLPLREKKMETFTCYQCHDELATWTQEELVATILNMRQGGEYAKITTEE